MAARGGWEAGLWSGRVGPDRRFWATVEAGVGWKATAEAAEGKNREEKQRRLRAGQQGHEAPRSRGQGYPHPGSHLVLLGGIARERRPHEAAAGEVGDLRLIASGADRPCPRIRKTGVAVRGSQCALCWRFAQWRRRRRAGRDGQYGGVREKPSKRYTRSSACGPGDGGAGRVACVQVQDWGGRTGQKRPWVREWWQQAGCKQCARRACKRMRGCVDGRWCGVVWCGVVLLWR